MIRQLLTQAARSEHRATRIAIVLSMMAAFASVALLALSGWFLTGAAIAGAGGFASAQAFNYLLPSAGIRGLAIVRTLSRYGERIFGHRAALFALADVRPALFARLAGTEANLALARSGGEMAARLGSDVDALEDSVVRKVTLPGAIVAVLAGLAAASLAGWAAALALLAGLGAMRLASWVLSRRLLTVPSRQYAEALNALKADYAEYAAGATEIAAYGLVPQITAALAPKIMALDAARLAIVRAETLVQGTQLVLAGISVAAVLALAAGGAPLVALAALAGAAAAESWSTLARTDMESLRTEDAILRLESIAALPGRARTVSSAGSASALSITNEDRSLSLQPGGRLLIAGPSGSGKSRLLGTLIGLRSDAPEVIAVDGRDVRVLGLDALRQQFAHAPQDASLIAGTVADNLRLARPGVTDEQMWSALDVVCLSETVRALPDGLNQWLGGDGARLSGGQRKRLALARALLAERPWLVLDEPSEGLDSATESELCRRLSQWLDATGTGLVLVSHREGLRSLADQILTLISPDG